MSKASRMFRWLLLCLVVVFAAAVLGSFATFAAAKFFEYRVSKLADKIKCLSIGGSTLADVQKLEREYRGHMDASESGCERGDCVFTFGLENTGFPSLYHQPLMWRLGVRPTYATATLAVRGGKLRYASFGIYTRTQYGYWLDGSFHAAPELTMFDRCRQSYLGRNSTYAVQDGHLTNGDGGGRILRTAFGAEASAAERSKATDLNISCITAVPSCREVTDLMPRAAEGMTFEADGDVSFSNECEAYLKQLQVGGGPWPVESAFSPNPISLSSMPFAFAR